MANIRAFNGVLYNQQKVNINDVVSPPYDVIPQKYREELFQKSEYNVIRLILGKEENWYPNAAKYFKEWREKEILIRDKKPTLYYLKQEFECEGKYYTRGGFISLCELIEFDKGVVLPHEKTLSGPKADRLELMKATNANFEQIYGLYYDKERKIEEYFKKTLDNKPDLTVTIEDVKNILWKLDDEEMINKVIQEMKDKKIYIADGHHRYETGITYRDYRRNLDPNYKGGELYDYILMFLTNVEDSGLVILPTHRAIFGLENLNFNDFKNQIVKYFTWEEYVDRKEAIEKLKNYNHHAFMFASKGKPGYIVIKLKDKKLLDEMIEDEKSEYVKNLDVTILHSYILRKILGISREAQVKKLNLEYEKDADTALDFLKEEKYQIIFILNASKIDEVTSIANEGGTMPQKSTYFFPKMYSGILFSPFEENV
jgi:uncharacterized protein (DUF1015 family)